MNTLCPHPNRPYIDRLMALWAQDPNAFAFSETEDCRIAWRNAYECQSGNFDSEYISVTTHTELTTFAERNGMYNAITCLDAYDDCGYMLDSDPNELALLAALGNDKAILLLPACKVFHKYRDTVSK